ncbi:Nucleoredoxin [Acipenser ruthenus]|uniref:Nucleoredoxin n=1 Tax=Acipenser ruthenus TaxID=7906 RepID=A0A444URQ2_ACIRT|nr:Nucleoredoxin [Acipenser ruthenus]
MSEFLVSLLGERLVNSEKAEVDVQSLGSKLSLVGLYFGCSLNGPCKQFNASLSEFYNKFKKSSENRDKLEIVFISSDQDQKLWQEFLQEMQWPALPFKEKHKKVWEKFPIETGNLTTGPAKHDSWYNSSLKPTGITRRKHLKQAVQLEPEVELD